MNAVDIRPRTDQAENKKDYGVKNEGVTNMAAKRGICIAARH